MYLIAGYCSEIQIFAMLSKSLLEEIFSILIFTKDLDFCTVSSIIDWWPK